MALAVLAVCVHAVRPVKADPEGFSKEHEGFQRVRVAGAQPAGSGFLVCLTKKGGLVALHAAHAPPAIEIPVRWYSAFVMRAMHSGALSPDGPIWRAT